MMEGVQQLNKDYPWIQSPLVVSAPMRLIALANMAVEVSKAGMAFKVMIRTSICATAEPHHF